MRTVFYQTCRSLLAGDSTAEWSTEVLCRLPAGSSISNPLYKYLLNEIRSTHS